MISMLLSAVCLGAPDLTYYPRSKSFYLVAGMESSKVPSWFVDGDPGYVHALKLEFARYADHFPSGVTGRYLSIKVDNLAFAESTSTIGAGKSQGGFTTTWAYKVSGGGIGGTDKLAFYAHGDTLDADTFDLEYRETATIGSVNHEYVYAATYKVLKQQASGDGPIDSRLAYGPPNEALDLQNPNGTLRNLNFNPWAYHGGRFVGNMPMDTGDRSWTSRSQFWFPEISSETDKDNIQLGFVSLMHLGFWPIPAIGNMPPVNRRPWESFDIGLYPGADDSLTEGTATWANKWSATGSAIESKNFAQWTATSQRDYVSWKLNTPAAPDGSVNLSGTDICLTRDLIKATDEANLIWDTTNLISKARWRYFVGTDGSAGPWPGGDNSYLPMEDKNPRLWVITLADATETETPPPDMERRSR